MTVVEWFRTIAFVLQDDEPGRPFQRYTLKDMIAAYNAALCLVAQYRQDMFTELKVIKLHAGKYQDARGCCTKVLDVRDVTLKQVFLSIPKLLIGRVRIDPILLGEIHG